MKSSEVWTLVETTAWIALVVVTGWGQPSWFRFTVLTLQGGCFLLLCYMFYRRWEARK